MKIIPTHLHPSQMEAELLEKLVYAMGQSGAPFFVTDASGVVEYANEAFYSANGLGPTAVLERPVPWRVPDRLTKDQQTEMWAAVKAGQQWRKELCLPNRAGEPYWEELLVSPILDNLGRLRGLAGSQRNITKRKVAELALFRSEQRLNRILATARDGIILVDGLGCVLLWNQAATRIFGYSPAEVTGKHVHDFLVSQPLRENQHHAFAEFQKSGQGSAIDRTTEMWALRKDQTEILVELSLSALEFEDKWLAVAVIRDVTERKKAEGEREMLVKSLEEALSRVKTLRGLIPICAACKKIRDDKGYWNQVESYVTAHSEATFTHGLCPSCAQKLYPEFASERPGEQSDK